MTPHMKGKRTGKRAGPVDVEERLEAVAKAFEAEDLDGVLAQADVLLEQAPEHPGVLH